MKKPAHSNIRRSAIWSAVLLFLILSASHRSGAEENFDLVGGAYRLSYETIRLPRRESLGLTSVMYLLQFSPSWYAGLGAFGAVSGGRGGFFTGGVETGFAHRLFDDLYADVGLFVGGGGGGAAPQGGGLMLRPHLGLWRDFGEFRAGVQYARVEFPNGDISSSAVAFHVDIPFTTLIVREGYAGSPAELAEQVYPAAGRPPGFVRDYFSVIYQAYFPSASVRNNDGTKTGPFRTVGMEFGQYASERWYLFANASGATEGNSAGYAEILAGVGYRGPLSTSSAGNAAGWQYDLRAAAGAAGGGRIHTNNGVILKTSLGLSYFLTPALSAGVSGGYVSSGRGDFQATMASINASYQADFASFDRRRSSPVPQNELYLSSWQAGLSHEVYLTRDPGMRRGQERAPVSLLGLKLNKPITDNFMITAQAWGAYSGGAGGYAAGLFGVRLASDPVLSRISRLFIEAAAGAAGGGGILVGGGTVAQALAGISVDVTKSVSIEAAYGRTKALDGPLGSDLYQLGLVYRFSKLNRKISGPAQ